MRRAFAAACLTLVTLAGSAAPAAASAYDQVLNVYEATGGTVPPCMFSSHQLNAALGGVDTYDAQYYADFTDAIQSALAQRAAGACGPHRSRARAVGVLPAAGVRLPSSATSPTDGSFPAPILLMGAVVLIGGLIAAVIAAFRAGGWDPAWAAASRHAWAEAIYRIEGRLARGRRRSP